MKKRSLIEIIANASFVAGSLDALSLPSFVLLKKLSPDLSPQIETRKLVFGKN